MKLFVQVGLEVALRNGESVSDIELVADTEGDKVAELEELVVTVLVEELEDETEFVADDEPVIVDVDVTEKETVTNDV